MAGSGIVWPGVTHWPLPRTRVHWISCGDNSRWVEWKDGQMLFSPYGSPIIIYICVYLSTSVFIIWFMCAQHGPEFGIRDRSALAQLRKRKKSIRVVEHTDFCH